MLYGSKTERSRCSPDFQGVLWLQHQVCNPEGQKYMFKSTSTEQRLSTPTLWYCLGKSLSITDNVTAHLRPQRLHCKQQNSSQHIMVNMLRGALIWQNEGRNSRTTTLVEEQLQPQKLRSLPSTSATFLENVKRCHYHVCNRKSALLPDPPSMIPAEFGWEADIENKTLLAQSLPYATALAPDYILRLIRCSCH